MARRRTAPPGSGGSDERAHGPALAALALLAPVLAPVPGVSPALAQAPPPAALEAGCDPGIREALAASAARGVEQDLAVIRNPDQGIRDPDSILDFSCLEDLFNYRAFNVLFDPGRALEEILGLAQRRVCEIARNTYRGYVGRTLDASVYTSRLPRLPGLHRLPGLDTDARNGNILQRQRGQRRTLPRHPGRWAMSTPVRCRTVFHAVILATALTATLAVPPAHAHSPCDPTDNDRAEASRVLAGLTREIDVMEATIVEALRLQTGQLSGYAAQSAKAVTGALDAQTKLQAQIAREVEETRAMRARRPTDSGCAAITGLAGLAATRQAAESAYVRAADAETGRIAGDRAAVPDAGAAAGNAARFESLTSTYCNGARAGEDAALCRGGDALHAADLKAGNLFDRRTFANEAELRTAVELSRNLAAPVVHDPPALASAETDQERRRILLARSADARAALAGDYFAHARALRAPGAALGAWAAQAAPGRDAATPVSRYELLELLASRRFENPGWFVDLQAMSQENLLRELVTLQAVSLMLDWRRYRLDERRGAIDATGLALGRRTHAASARPRQPGRRSELTAMGALRFLFAPELTRPLTDAVRSSAELVRRMRPFRLPVPANAPPNATHGTRKGDPVANTQRQTGRG